MLWVIYYIIKKEFILDGVVDINVDKNRYSMSTVMSWAYNMAVCTVMFTTRMSVIFNSDVMKSSLYS